MPTPKIQLDTVQQVYSPAAVNSRILNRLDTAVQLVLQSVNASTVPSSPQLGQSWWLPPTVNWTGTAFENRGNQIATWWYGWQFMVPFPGMLAYIESEQRVAAYQASRSWASIATILHYPFIFTDDFIAPKPVFYTERGAQLVQFRTGINYTGSGSVSFYLFYYEAPVAGGGQTSPVQMLAGGTFATISDINQGHTEAVNPTIPADSWVYFQPFGAVGTVNSIYVELMITELL